MKSIESSARTMEEAVTQGLEKLGLSLGDVTIDILQEGTKGFLGLVGGKPVVVKLTVRDGVDDSDILSSFALGEAVPPVDNAKGAPGKKGKNRNQKTKQQVCEKAETPAAKPKDAGERADKSERAVKKEKAIATKADKPGAFQVGDELTPAPLCDPETPEGKAQQFLLKVTELMGLTVRVAASRDEEGNVRVDIHGDTLGILIGRRGETLDAMQYLTSLNVNRDQEQYVRVTLDTENYRAKREEALTRLANRMASRAVKTGRKVVLEPMNPYERRILHSALQQNDAVTTHSEGEEPNRHVVITLK